MKTHIFTSICKLLIFTQAILFPAYFARLFFNDILMKDLAGIGWLWGILGTLYALFAAFVLVAVWEHFNRLSDALSGEARMLVSIWNYADYLDDEKVSSSMKKSILRYIEAVTTREVALLSKHKHVPHPSPELIEIMETIDRVEFNGPRDESAFKALINAYDTLELKRQIRIQESVAQVPLSLKTLFILVSVFFVSSAILNGFANPVLYYISTAFISMIVFSTYTVIDDLDRPYEGLWKVSYEGFTDAKEYIEKKEHGAKR